MMILGTGFYPSWQRVSWLDTEAGDCGERKLVMPTVTPKCFISNWWRGAGGRKPAGEVADDAAGSGAEHGTRIRVTIGDVSRFRGASRWRVIWD